MKNLGPLAKDKDALTSNAPALFHEKTKSDAPKGKERKHRASIETSNYVDKPRHYPPANKEWFNSVYTYGKSTSKLAPTQDKVTQKLVKGYFNLYSVKLEGRVKSITKRMRIRTRRLSTNRILIGRAEAKHTNDRVILTIYVYNRQKQYYLNKIARLGALVKSVSPTLVPESLELRKRAMVVKRKSLSIKSSMATLRDRIQKQINVVGLDMNETRGVDTMGEAKQVLWLARARDYETSYLRHYVSRSLRREMLSTYLLQLLSFNESKFEEKYLLPLTRLVRRVYWAPDAQDKEVEFNFVNLRYPYLNSSVFSAALLAKIRNRKNKLLRVLRAGLALFKVPSVEATQRAVLYKEIYKKQRRHPSLKLNQDSDFLPALMENATPLKYDTTVDRAKGNQLMTSGSYALVNTTLESIKNRAVSGIRLEVAGRLTKRNTAARSLFKLRYKGNLQNMDASYKGLSTVLLRGHAKSNLQYTKTASKIRIGSFGLKGWVSSS